ncbi:helix-turn-helix domain-containing protein [Nocardioides soli]|uniref:Transcriptional regulator with XRE-family HTH domain n=1 Tax=Nocardioides soli TaxID=1036020 RepID=A0A7W4W1I5_9ACTN|nr:helix-turn-helix transcriptional regulator [Nocardioides soli]MBB3045758.1 transcriptional regulator with XRE-family HTH domain [Nocardioides soli]
MAKRPPQARLVRAGRQLGSHVATWRKLQNLTAEQLADRAGISRPTLTKLESGNLGVTLSTYLNVLRALGQLDRAVEALDPYETDLGRARADDALPQRVRGPAR